ncbi:SCO family protein [Burkholderia glumae]|uniref:SCO family protein n=4 Tax=Burkholderia glumae TaxID=337 RepID=A0AAP9Y3S6_BURGL|nr:SCO family protein [Burkholderia glumae]PNL02162.1 SCO family protein [Burkholderia glumae]QGA38396.1 redoxin domain-containing protein [Burkholderia glumae]QKM53904.1 SCO1 protein [Burkholderia glumae]QPQ94086.1 SCO family protein [Burkholderia glumae]
MPLLPGTTRRQPPRGSHRARPAMARAGSAAGAALVLAAACALGACSPRGTSTATLTDVSGHLPDLAFSLTGEDGRPIDAAAFRGRVALVYFGYTHCPDVCPTTMARLMQVLARLGPDADRVRILFVSVDPARDTPALLRAYVGAFDAKHAVGLTGSAREIETLAKRYRIAYQMDAPDASGDYAVTHSSAVYVFDARGRARRLATDQDSPEAIAADLRGLLGAPAS